MLHKWLCAGSPAALSSDGSLVALRENTVVGCDDNVAMRGNSVAVWRVLPFSRIIMLRDSANMGKLLFASRALVAAGTITGDRSCNTCVWDLLTGVRIAQYESLKFCAISDDGAMLAGKLEGNYHHGAEVCFGPPGRPRWRFMVGRVLQCTFSPDNGMIAVTTTTTCHMIELAGGTTIARFLAGMMFSRPAFSLDCQHIAFYTAGECDVFKVDAGTGLLWQSAAPSQYPHFVAYSADGQRIAAVTGTDAYVLDAATGRVLHDVAAPDEDSWYQAVTSDLTRHVSVKQYNNLSTFCIRGIEPVDRARLSRSILLLAALQRRRAVQRGAEHYGGRGGRGGRCGRGVPIMPPGAWLYILCLVGPSD